MLLDAYSRPVSNAPALSAGVGGSGISDMSSFGETLDEFHIKKTLRSMNPGMHFDMGACLNLYHPRMDEWQGVFYNGEHICAMDRGVIPEYDIWRLDPKTNERIYVLRIGWRSTFELIVRKRLPRITWESLCRAFRVDMKRYDGEVMELAARL